MAQHRDVAVPVPTVLVVDDDPAIRSSLKFSLEVEGFAVRTYTDGDELLKEADLPGHGCLIIDYNLPGISGLDLLVELRKRDVSLPAILITTHPSATVRNRAEISGARLIEKPLLGDTLFRGIWDAVGQTQAG